MKVFEKIKRVINSIILCIRFPFLYPRNRFTGLHYNSWNIVDKIREYHKCAVHGELKDGKFVTEIISKKAYVKWFLLKFFHDYILQLFHCVPTYTELDAMESGWRKSFGIQMCKDIKRALLKDVGIKGLYGYRIMQIKEKYGQNRIYDAWTTKRVMGVIAKYENISERTCVICGKKAIGKTTGYILPYCKQHIPENAFFETFNDKEYCDVSKSATSEKTGTKAKKAAKKKSNAKNADSSVAQKK